VSNFNREILEEGFQKGEKAILTVTCADAVVLLAKEETLLQGIIDKVTKIGISHRVQMNFEKNLR
jgi:hypothetical protein